MGVGRGAGRPSPARVEAGAVMCVTSHPSHRRKGVERKTVEGAQKEKRSERRDTSIQKRGKEQGRTRESEGKCWADIRAQHSRSGRQRWRAIFIRNREDCYQDRRDDSTERGGLQLRGEWQPVWAVRDPWRRGLQAPKAGCSATGTAHQRHQAPRVITADTPQEPAERAFLLGAAL